MKTAVVAALVALAHADSSHKSTHEFVKEAFLKSRREKSDVFVLPLEERPPSYRSGRIECTDGEVRFGGNTYNCDGIDLLSFITTEELMIPGVQYDLSSSDIWGWKSEASGKEVTLLTLDTGVVFIDSTDPENPCLLAKARSRRSPSPWGDIKVVGNVAYAIKDKSPFVASEDAPGTGMEVYDLEVIDRMDCTVDGYEVPFIRPTFTGADHGSCHNVVSNTETERVYSVGCRDTCDGGLVIFDVSGSNKLRPKMIGCVSQDGYTHDAQCVIYTGPDAKYRGREVCVAFNEDTLTLWDVSDAAAPHMISRTLYKNQAYSHQGWLNPEMTKVFLDDELDEECGLDKNTRTCRSVINDDEFDFEKNDGKTVTKVFNIEDLENPFEEFEIVHDTLSIDHNLYVWGPIHERGWGGNGPLESVPSYDLMYLNNYMAGLQVINISDPTYPRASFFDITEETEVEFFGSWSGYMHPSGVYAISSIERGIFFLDAKETFVPAREFVIPEPGPGGAAPSPTPDPNPSPSPNPSPIPSPSPNPSPIPSPSPNPSPTGEGNNNESGSDGASPVLYVFFAIFLLGTVYAGFLTYQNRTRKQQTNEASVNHYVDANEKQTL